MDFAKSRETTRTRDAREARRLVCSMVRYTCATLEMSTFAGRLVDVVRRARARGAGAREPAGARKTAARRAAHALPDLAHEFL